MRLGVPCVVGTRRATATLRTGELVTVEGALGKVFEGGEVPGQEAAPGAGEAQGLIQVDEYRADGDLVIRAEMPGLDPERDVEVTVDDDILHIRAEHREEEKREGKDYYRRELRYGSFSRDLQLPAGASDSEIKATYKDGILEVHVPLPEADKAKSATKKVPVTT